MQGSRGSTERISRLIIIGVSVVALSGCTRLQLPRIDPSGQRLFLPAPEYTTIQSDFPFGGRSTFRGPAYQTPSTPPPCPPGVSDARLSTLSATSSGSAALLVAGNSQDVRTALRPIVTEAAVQPDIKWLLPEATTGNPGIPVELITTVRRVSQDAPAIGTIVRYSVEPESHLRFVSTNKSTIDVRVDKLGQARVQLVRQLRDTAETRVAVQVLHSANDAPKTAPRIVGQGTTTIRWAAPALVLRVVDPDRFDVDSTATIRVDVTNIGEAKAESVVVSDVLPMGIRFLNSDPPAQVFGDRVQWQIGDLEAGKSRVIEFHCRAERTGGFEHHLQARARNASTAEEHIVARVTDQPLELHVRGPETARVGDQVQYRIVARNVGSQPLTNVIVYDAFDLGFVHEEAESPIKRGLGDLPPGEEIAFAVTFTVTEAGTICHHLQLNAEGGVAASQRLCLSVTGDPQHGSGAATSQPQIVVSKHGPTTLDVGQEAEFTVRIENNGTVPIENIEVEDKYPTGVLRPLQASDGFRQAPGAMVWTVERLAPGEYTMRTVRYRCESASPSACNAVSVTSSAPAVTAADEICLVIHGLGDLVQETEEGPVLPEPGTADASSQENLRTAETSSSVLTIPGLSAPAPLDLADSSQLRNDMIAANNVALETPRQDPLPLSQEGDLQLTLTDLNDPVRAGGRMVFLIHVVNDRNTSDQDLQLQIAFPENLKLENTNMQLTRGESSAANIHLFMTDTIRELRPGEELLLRLEFTAAQPGQAYLQAMLSSARSSPMVVSEESTIVGN